MKTKELRLLELCFTLSARVSHGGGWSIREAADALGIAQGQAYYYAMKWDKKGWIDYGTTVMAPWFTRDGQVAVWRLFYLGDRPVGCEVRRPTHLFHPPSSAP